MFQRVYIFHIVDLNMWDQKEALGKALIKGEAHVMQIVSSHEAFVKRT